MNKDELLVALATKIADDFGSRHEDWAHLVAVGKYRDGKMGMTGFIFEHDGSYQSAAPQDPEILDLLAALRDRMATDDGKEQPWVACSIRIDRETGELTGDFDYTAA